MQSNQLNAFRAFALIRTDDLFRTGVLDGGEEMTGTRHAMTLDSETWPPVLRLEAPAGRVKGQGRGRSGRGTWRIWVAGRAPTPQVSDHSTRKPLIYLDVQCNMRITHIMSNARYQRRINDLGRLG